MNLNTIGVLRKENCYFSRRNFCDGRVMVWWTFCSRRTFPLSFTSSKTSLVLDTHLLPFLRRFCCKKYISQLDNAIIHTNSTTSQCFSANYIQVLKWPACLPDLNPTKSLWGILVRKMYANNKKFYSTDELKALILNVWSKTDAKLTSHLVHSINNCIF